MKTLIRIVFMVLMALLTAPAGAVQSFTLVSPESCASVVVDVAAPESVWLAAVDLTNDVKKISGMDLALLRGVSAAEGDVFVSIERDGRWEAYSVEVNGGVLKIVGSDERGAMFGIYDFIERYLGVDPLWFWSGVPHPKRRTLSWERIEIKQSEPTFRFRGWFVNDEDLLTAWRPGSGTRDYSGYMYYHDVVNHDTMRAIAEAAVRLRMNLIIPASLLNILNPAERGLVEICARRGLFVSMHHVEPMGVSGFAFESRWKGLGESRDYSYFRYREDVEAMWRESAAEWAKFPNVVWQIGLRGKGDRAMWITDPTIPKDEAGRAKLISRALARQLEILDEIGVPRKGRVVTTTLWAEGTVFNEKGLLEIPEGTTVVFADNNCGWKWQKDLLYGPRNSKSRYGVYYHHQLIGMGPHLVSLVPAAKTAEMLREACAKGAKEYAIFNVGNVREFVYGLDATAKMSWALDVFDAEKWTCDWLEHRVPSASKEWQGVVNAHYAALSLHPATGVPCFLDGLMQQQSRVRLERIEKRMEGEAVAPEPIPFEEDFVGKRRDDPFWDSLSSMYPTLGSPYDTIKRLAMQASAFGWVVKHGEAALAKTFAAERTFAEDQLLYPARVMLAMTAAEIELYEAEDAFARGDASGCREHLSSACLQYDLAIVAGRAYCHDKWTGWYNDCRKVSIARLRDRTGKVLAKMAAK